MNVPESKDPVSSLTPALMYLAALLTNKISVEMNFNAKTNITIAHTATQI